MLSGTQQEASVGEELFRRSRWAEARGHFLEAIRRKPGFAYYYFAAAMCNWANGQLDEAGEYLQMAVRLNPALGAAQAWLGEWYLINGMIDVALQATNVAMTLEPENTQFMQSRAWVLQAAGEMDAAWALVQKLIVRMPMTSSLARLYGRLAERYGQTAQALAAIDKLVAAGLGPGESAVHFTAAALLDSAGRYDEAFAHACIANASYRGQPYDPAMVVRQTNQRIRFFTRQRALAMPKATLRCDKPVFVLGMPRSGTSLVEQILASHPAVHGAGELDFLNRVVLGTAGMVHGNLDDWPACLEQFTTAHADGMAHIYLAPFIALKPDATRIIDKMPLNFLFLGLIASLFPDARIIHCVRDPMDTCLSCFISNFNAGHEFKYNLSHLGHFYRQYQRLMAHWKSVLDIPILDVCYEQVIADQEGQSRRMVQFLGLPWDDRCLQFYKTRRACVTESSLQVRKPLYATSMQRWRNYEKYLAPLKTALAAD